MVTASVPALTGSKLIMAGCEVQASGGLLPLSNERANGIGRPPAYSITSVGASDEGLGYAERLGCLEID
jgi:hypothetical protein